MFNLKGLSYKKKLAVAACISSIISGTFTYVVLSMAAAAGRNQAALNSVPPDYVRYAAMGYSSETVTSKKNILFSITDDGSLCRTHLLCFDIDKHTLDILEIPCDTLISFDGYDGNFCEAYHTGVYKDIVSRVLLFDIDGVIEMDTNALSDCVTVLGGVELSLDKPVDLDGYALSKGKRRVTGSVAELIVQDSSAYSSGREDSILAYRGFLASLINTLDKMGTAQWFNKLLGIIINQIETDMDINEIISLAGIADKVPPEDINLWLLPGQGCVVDWKRAYAADIGETAALLNENFRVKDVVRSGDDLGLKNVSGTTNRYGGLKENIEDILT